MAGGKYYDESGDFDAAANDFGGDQHGVSTGARLNGQEVDGYGDPVKKSRFGKKEDENGRSSWGLLRDGERDASQNPNRSGRGGDKSSTLGQKESNVSSDNSMGGGKFKNAVKGVNALKTGRVGKAKGHFRKSGPLIAILVGMLGFGGASFFSQMAMPFSLVAQLQEKYDSISVSQNMRSKSFLKWQTAKDSGKVKDCIKAHYFKADEFKISDKQKAKLAKSNITVEEDADGVTVLKHRKADGSITTIVADSSLAKDGRVSFNDAFENDAEFRTNYTEGSRTWRGSVGAWFDSSMDKLLKKLGVYRGVWSDFKSGKVDDEKMGEMRKTMSDSADSDSAGGKVKGTDVTGQDQVDGSGKPTVDENGNKVQKAVLTENSESTSLSRKDIEFEGGKVKNADGVKTKLKTAGKLAAKANAGSQGFSSLINIYCGVADAVGAITAIVAAYQAMQVVKTAASVLEGIQKAKAGDSDGAPLHELMTSLTTTDESTYEEVKGIKTTGSSLEADDADVEVTDMESITRKRSAMESEGIGALYSGKMANSNDPSVKSFIPGSFFSSKASGALANIIGSVDTSVKAFQSCTIARLAAAGVSAATGIVEALACILTAGIGCLVDMVIEEAGSMAFSIGLGLLVSVVVSFALPQVVKVLTRKIATDVVGEDLGNALVSGTNMYMSKNHQNSGGSLIGQDDLAAYLQQRDVVIAENARYERETRSPFDITSKYTFMGSLVNQMIPLASSMTSLTRATSSMGTLLQNSIVNLSPQSSAVSSGIEANEAKKNTEKHCPDLYEIGAVGDAFCNPYVGTDTRTMNTQPADIVNSLSDDDLEDVSGDKGTPTIKKDSDLAKYIIYCGQRSSQFGTADQNIASEVDGGSTGSSTGDTIIGAVPIVGDVLDVISNGEKLKNLGYITGEACVTSNDTSALNWGDYGSKYQRFIEDQRLAEAEGLIEKSAVTEFVASYYEEHPIDNSYEGLLARYSGLTKEKVIAVLDFIELSNWVADYEPSGLYPYPNSSFEAEGKKIYVEETDNYGLLATIPYYANTSKRLSGYVTA